MNRVTPPAYPVTALLAGCMALLEGAAMAQTPPSPISGLYIGAGIGANVVPSPSPDQRLTGPADLAAGRQAVRLRPRTGIAGNLAIGWGFGQGLRLELEGNAHGNRISDGRIGNTQLSRTGNRGMGISTSGVMVNALYDIQALRFDIGVPVTPYIGLGLGVASVAPNRFDLSAGNGQALRLNGSQSLFAYQGIIGLGWELDRLTPALALTTEYRFMATAHPNFHASYVPARGGAAVAGNLRAANDNHGLLVGLRYAFNAPAVPAPQPQPMAAPVAAPATARTYLVFFDWNRADLTDRARGIIADAAAGSGATRIDVAGHADRSGIPQYNQALSQRRAEAVAAELTRRGVAREAIDIRAYGESRPLVPTADGAREPQNRRVEIVLR